MSEFLETGDVISILKGMKVYTEVPNKLFNPNTKFSKRTEQIVIEIGYPNKVVDTHQFEGEYIVTRTALQGGGQRGLHDSYPDGHYVVCKQLKDGVYDEDGLEISFYQSGCFTVEIPYIRTLRKMKMVFL